MLILKEENSHLKGTKHTLPKKIVDLCHDIILKYPQYSANGGYRKSNHVLESGGVVTMEWLKGMKSFFNKHVNTNDIDFVLGGGILMKTFVDNKLDQLTASTPKTRKQHTNSAVKPVASADNLSGHRGEKSSPALSMVNSLMSSIIPKLNSSIEKQIDGKTFLIKESQLNILKEYETPKIKLSFVYDKYNGQDFISSNYKYAVDYIKKENKDTLKVIGEYKGFKTEKIFQVKYSFGYDFPEKNKINYDLYLAIIVDNNLRN